jgi:crotonobetainyl-CoA:carnitine CoA-transferase CaiB-like acyl-CoA transferase
MVEIHHPDIGPVEYPQSPDRMSGTPGRVQRRGPRLGEHSSEILASWLGLDHVEIQKLADQGAIWYP